MPKAEMAAATFAGSVVAEPMDNIDVSHDRARSSAIEHLPRLHQDAEQGSPLAQYVLGALYQLGEVVPQDHAEAVRWLRRSADQGLAVAQFVLGEMYASGQGVPEDIIRAHMWLNLSAAGAAHIPGAQKLARDAQELRDTLAWKMTPAQIAEAQRLAPLGREPASLCGGGNDINHRHGAVAQRPADTSLSSERN